MNETRGYNYRQLWQPPAARCIGSRTGIYLRTVRHTSSTCARGLWLAAHASHMLDTARGTHTCLEKLEVKETEREQSPRGRLPVRIQQLPAQHSVRKHFSG